MLFIAILLGVVFLSALITGFLLPGKNPDDRYSTGEGKVASFATAGIAFLLMLVAFGFASFVKVDAGEAAVEVLFGKVRVVHGEGLHPKNPMSNIVRYPVRTVESTYIATEDEGEKKGQDAIQAYSAENAAVYVDLTVLWHVNPVEAGHVYKTVKDQYRDVLVRPITRSATRDCVALFDFDVARTTARGEVSTCILERMEKQLGPRGIIVESIQLRGMRADATLQQSIEAKLQAANAVKEAEFRRQQAEVDKERAIIEAEARAEAKIAEARGEADRITTVADAEAEANKVVAESLSDQILQLRIFEALSASDSNLILMGGTDGVTPLLPLPTP